MGKYFGTDGFRGEANVDLTVTHAYKVGRYLGYYYGKGKKSKIVIGKDTRRSSYMFEYALVSGLTASGVDVYLLHVTPTPSVAYVVRSEGFDCGIMISASHNPYYDNGIKIFNGEGMKLESQVEEEIEAYLDQTEDTLALATKEQIGCVIDYSVGRHRYIGYLMSLATRSFKGVKVGLDCSNGSASTIAKGVFDALGAKTFTIYNEPNGININEHCGSTHIEKLQNYVLEHQLDVGFAYDGDADRCIAIDDKGKIIDGDLTLYLCGCYMKERGELEDNKVVATIMSNIGLFLALEEKGIGYEKTTVGDKYVNECMMNNGYSLGGEQSGHIIFSKHATTGDGVLTSLKIMEVMLEKKSKLSDLTKDIRIFPQLLKNVRVKNKKNAKEEKAVLEAVEKRNQELGKEGRILVRESGTEPVIRVMAEAKTDELCEKYVNEILDILRVNGHIKENN